MLPFLFLAGLSPDVVWTSCLSNRSTVRLWPLSVRCRGSKSLPLTAQSYSCPGPTGRGKIPNIFWAWRWGRGHMGERREEVNRSVFYPPSLPLFTCSLVSYRSYDWDSKTKGIFLKYILVTETEQWFVQNKIKKFNIIMFIINYVIYLTNYVIYRRLMITLLQRRS